MPDLEQLRKAQKQRARRYGISPKTSDQGGNLTPPKGYPTEEKFYGDPVNYRYPAESSDRAQAALAYFNDATNRTKGGYSPTEWAKIGKRLARLISKALDSDYVYSDGSVKREEDSEEARMNILDASTPEELILVAEAIKVSSQLHAAASRLAQIEEDDRDEAIEQLQAVTDSLDVLESEVLYTRASDTDALLVEMNKGQAMGMVKAITQAVEDEDWDAVKSAAGKLVSALGKQGGGDAEEGEEGLSEVEDDELVEVSLNEQYRSDNGSVVGILKEADPGDAVNPDRAPLRMYIRVIEPGWGNERDNNYYPREVIERDAHVFEDAKMYVTDHKSDEKNARSEVAVIEKCPAFFDKDGAAVAIAHVFDPDFAEATRNRKRADKLETLRCSILAKGRVKPDFEEDGRKGNRVEEIKGDPKPDVDWVTRDGAGGHALDFVEGADVTEYLSPEDVQNFLSETGLPEVAREWVAEGQYETEASLSEAADRAAQRVKKLTGSGQPFGRGSGSGGGGGKPLSEEEYEAEMQKVFSEHGVNIG